MIQMIAIICYWSVDIFAILTGYLYYDKKEIKSKRIITLLITVLFYCAIITFVIGLIRPDLLRNNILEIIKSLFPPIDGFYWYITCYTFVFFMIPYINRFLHLLGEKEYLVFVLALVILLSIIPTIGIADYFRTSRGYSPWWLLFCYVLGGYIKRVNLCEKYCKKLFYRVILGNVIVVFLLWNILLLAIRKLSIGEGVLIRIVDYVSPFTVVNAICVVSVFSQIKINKSLEKCIKSLSAASFGVYILHCHRLIFLYFLKDAFQWIAEYNFIIELMAFMGIICTIYVICWMIECLREKLFVFFKADKAIEHLGNRIDKVLMWK